MANTYDIGDLVRLTGTFSGTDGTLVDPTTVVLKIKPPGGSVSTVTPTRESTGVHYHDYTPSAHGTHLYRFEGTGAAQAAEDSVFYVRKSRVT